jgi:hypothetical protein
MMSFILPALFFGGRPVTRGISFLAALLAIFMLSGCGPVASLFGLGEHGPIDRRLLGEWLLLEEGKPSSDKKKSHVSIRPSANGQSYEMAVLNYADNGQTLLVSANLVAIDRFLFLDFYPPNSYKKDCAKERFPVLKAHIFAKVSIEKERVSWYFLDGDWVEQQYKQHKLEIDSMQGENELFLSAKSEDLRKFVLNHAEDEEAFSGYYLLTKQK